MGALSGVKVLDVATLFPAPVLAATLGDFGADVVKVEPPEGDPLRALGPVPWAVAGRNKRSISIDFDSSDGLDMLHRLIAVADVVVLNQPATVLERWGCTDDEISELNARAIIVHVTAFGSTGPYSERAGNGTLAEAFVGLPIGSVPLGDSMASVTGVVGVLAALYWRDARGGNGQVVDVSLYESLLPLLAPAVAGLAPRTLRSRREIVEACDGLSVAISATTDPQLQRLRALVGSDDVAAWVAARAAATAVLELVAARVPAVVVNDVAQLLNDEHLVARESVVSVDGTTVPSPTPGLSATPGAITHLGPGLGDHTDEVLTEWLGGGTT
jgi:crotonobetainyl-CoA:carnitine CoA-transferase CaiB-like acyl-CoA transferase